MTDKYNLDEEDKFIPFIFDGNKYELWFPTTEEVEKVSEAEEDSAFENFLLDHIKKPEGANYPEFKEVKGKMNVKQTVKFRDMINTELGING